MSQLKVNLTITLVPYPTKSCYDTPFVKLHVNGVFLNSIAFSFTYTNPTTHAIGVCRNNYELSNRISYCVCTFDDVSYVVCRVEVATPPVQVPLTQEDQKDESTPCLTVRDRSNLSTVSMNVVSHVASLITLNLTPAELRF